MFDAKARADGKLQTGRRLHHHARQWTRHMESDRLINRVERLLLHQAFLLRPQQSEALRVPAHLLAAAVIRPADMVAPGPRHSDTPLSGDRAGCACGSL